MASRSVSRSSGIEMLMRVTGLAVTGALSFMA
jgi:hypothetical protein